MSSRTVTYTIASNGIEVIDMRPDADIHKDAIEYMERRFMREKSRNKRTRKNQY